MDLGIRFREECIVASRAILWPATRLADSKSKVRMVAMSTKPGETSEEQIEEKEPETIGRRSRMGSRATSRI